jgi:hypothetical protein
MLPNRTLAIQLITMASLSAFNSNKRDKVPGFSADIDIFGCSGEKTIP